MIKAVILDCFGVLYIPKHQYVYQSLLLNPTVHHDEIRDLVRQAEYGFISDEELYEGIAMYTGVPLEKLRRDLGSEFVRNLELLEYAQRLRATCRLALLSNLGRDRIDHFFTPEERTRLFDVVVVSSEVGMIKPNPEIYEYACTQLGVDVSEAVMIDDVEDNCAGAREAGLLAIHYESLPQARRDLERLLK